MIVGSKGKSCNRVRSRQVVVVQIVIPGEALTVFSIVKLVSFNNTSKKSCVREADPIDVHGSLRIVRSSGSFHLERVEAHLRPVCILVIYNILVASSRPGIQGLVNVNCFIQELLLSHYALSKFWFKVPTAVAVAWDIFVSKYSCFSGLNFEEVLISNLRWSLKSESDLVSRAKFVFNHDWCHLGRWNIWNIFSKFGIFSCVTRGDDSNSDLL